MPHRRIVIAVPKKKLLKGIQRIRPAKLKVRSMGNGKQIAVPARKLVKQVEREIKKTVVGEVRKAVKRRRR